MDTASETRGGALVHEQRVLMVVPAWPPVNTVGGRRPLRLARRLPALGWEPVILTPDPPGGFYPEPPGMDAALSTPAVETHRVPALFPGVLWRRALQLTLSTRVPRLEKLAQIACARFLLPDHLVEWIPAAVAQARRVHRTRPIDVVWGTAPPFGAAAVTAAVAQAIGRPYVLDFRDPWTQAPRLSPRRVPFGIPRAAHAALEGALLRCAAGVSYVYDQNADWNRKRFGQPEHAHWVTIANGYDEADLPSSSVHRFPEPTVLYAGSCYGGRTLEPIFAAFRQRLERREPCPRLLFRGELDPTSRRYFATHAELLRTHVDIAPRIPIEQLAPLMRGAHALLLLTGDEHRHAIGAKIFDYFLAGRPILAIGPADAAAADVIRSTGTGRWISTEEGPDRVAQALDEIVSGQFPLAKKPSESGRQTQWPYA